VKEHLLSGKPLTRLEAIVLFGCSNLPEVVYELRKTVQIEGSKRVPYATAMVRINEHATLTPPANLPIRDIMLTEYRLKR
jgi:hypothetical protein